MKTDITVNYDPANGILTDAEGCKWVRKSAEQRKFSMEDLVHIAHSCSFMTDLMETVEKEMLSHFEEGESK